VATDQQRRIRPIATRYSGFLFRSRLEARWALFFDELGIKWLYEPQGFEVDGRAYLPDFCLLLGEMLWAEVKPAIDTDPDGISRWRAFICARGDRGVLLTDMTPAEPWDQTYLVLWPQEDGNYSEDDAARWCACPDGYHFDVRWPSGQCGQCGADAERLEPSFGYGWDPGDRRISAAFDAARSARFDQRVSSG
jgi:hypothetical protein